jgi:ABC-type branched-subunit amino acid transport system substrate-binding protein
MIPALALLLFQAVDAVPIGYFGPTDPAHPTGGSFWVGASQALAEVNREGGYKGKPFRLVTAWSENPWAGGISRLAQISYDEDVRAVIGSIDGTSTHLVEQVAAKALFPVVDPGSTDRTVNLAPVPWIFSCLPSDRDIAAAIGSAVIRPFVIVRGTDHDSRALSKEFERWLALHDLVPARVVDYVANVPELDLDVRTLVILAPPAASVTLVRELRRAHPDTNVLGGPAMGRSAFVEDAGGAAEGIRVPLLAAAPPDHPDWDYGAVQAYDAVRLLTSAIRTAGLDRERIRDALRAMSGWDAFGRNTRPVRLGTIKSGRIL